MRLKGQLGIFQINTIITIKILSVGIFLFDIVYDNIGYIALFIIVFSKTFRSQDVSIRNVSFILVELHIYLRIR